jgi:hypothetical protein
MKNFKSLALGLVLSLSVVAASATFAGENSLISRVGFPFNFPFNSPAIEQATAFPFNFPFNAPEQFPFN